MESFFKTRIVIFSFLSLVFSVYFSDIQRLDKVSFACNVMLCPFFLFLFVLILHNHNKLCLACVIDFDLSLS